MTDRERRMAFNRLCSAARTGRTYHPEACMRCESPCKYGTRLLREMGMERFERETPKQLVSVTSSDRLRRCLKAFNRQNISRR